MQRSGIRGVGDVGGGECGELLVGGSATDARGIGLAADGFLEQVAHEAGVAEPAVRGSASTSVRNAPYRLVEVVVRSSPIRSKISTSSSVV